MGLCRPLRSFVVGIVEQGPVAIQEARLFRAALRVAVKGAAA